MLQVPPMHSFSPIPQSDSVPVFQPTVVAAASAVVAPPSTPAFLSRFPRSLSSLSLGTKKKPSDKDSSIVTSTTTSSSSNTPVSSPNTSFQSPGDSPYAMNTTSTHQHHPYMHHHHHQQHHSHVTQRSSGGNFSADAIGPPHKKKFGYGQSTSVESNDVPPPLPQRNMPRKPSDCGVDMFGSDVNLRRSKQVSDLDHSQCAVALTSPLGVSANNNAAEKTTSSGGSGKGKSRSKTPKIKALSDPKMSSQMFIEMEQSLGGHNDKEPPPLPPRQPGMLEEKQNVMNNNKFGSAGGASTNYGNRPPPNSIDTLMNYPLTTTTQAVRDNFAAFPLSHRPNVQQILQQQSYNSQQHLQHNSSTTTSAATTVLSKSTVSNVLSHTNIHAHTCHSFLYFDNARAPSTIFFFQAHSQANTCVFFFVHKSSSICICW